MTTTEAAEPQRPLPDRPTPDRTRPPRWPWLAGLALIAGALTLLWWPQAPDDALLGQPAPGFALPVLGAATFDGPANHHNQLVLLHFWGPTCPPCVAEIEVWQRLAERAPREGFTVLTVSGDERAEIEAFLAARQLRLPVLLDATGRVHGAYHVRALPTTVALGPDGRVKAVLEGARPSAQYETLLGQKGN